MTLAITLFVIGAVGFTLYRSHALILLLALELILLSITILALLACITYDDGQGQTLSIVYICIAGGESAIGLSVLIAYYRLRGTLSLRIQTLYLTLVVLPFAGCLITALRGRTIGFTGACLVTCGSIGVSAVLSWIAVYEVILSRSPVTVGLFTWVSLDTVTLSWSLAFDDLTVIICAVVLTVSFIVHIYSVDYMAGDPHGQRFICLLSLFTASMVLLVCGDSLGLLFVGWELIGVSSFLLIGFWSTRVQAVKSALKAILVNRVGDIFLTLGLVITVTLFGSLDYAVVFASASIANETALVTLTLIMLIGGIAKSAQVPLHSWLAAAMEGKNSTLGVCVMSTTTSLINIPALLLNNNLPIIVQVQFNKFSRLNSPFNTAPIEGFQFNSIMLEHLKVNQQKDHIISHLFQRLCTVTLIFLPFSITSI